jgi:hypothetical protein
MNLTVIYPFASSPTLSTVLSAYNYSVMPNNVYISTEVSKQHKNDK